MDTLYDLRRMQQHWIMFWRKIIFEYYKINVFLTLHYFFLRDDLNLLRRKYFLSREQIRLRRHMNSLPKLRKQTRLPQTQFKLRKPGAVVPQTEEEQFDSVSINAPISEAENVGTINFSQEKPFVSDTAEEHFEHFQPVSRHEVPSTPKLHHTPHEFVEPLPIADIPTVSVADQQQLPHERIDEADNEAGIIDQIPKSSKEHVFQIQSLLNSLVEKKKSVEEEKEEEPKDVLRPAHPEFIEEETDRDTLEDAHDSVYEASEQGGVVYQTTYDHQYPRGEEVFEYIEEDQPGEDHFQSPREANPANDDTKFRAEIRSLVRAALCQIFSEQGFNGISFCHHLNFQARRPVAKGYQTPASNHWQGAIYRQPYQEWQYQQPYPHTLPWDLGQRTRYQQPIIGGDLYHKSYIPGKHVEAPGEYEDQPSWNYQSSHHYPDPHPSYRLPRRSKVNVGGSSPHYGNKEDARSGWNPSRPSLVPPTYPEKEVLPPPVVQQQPVTLRQRERFQAAQKVGTSDWKPTNRGRNLSSSKK